MASGQFTTCHLTAERPPHSHAPEPPDKDVDNDGQKHQGPDQGLDGVLMLSESRPCPETRAEAAKRP